MKDILFNNALFGLAISFSAYSFGVFLQRKTKKTWLNPLLVSYAIIIAFLLIFDISLEWYMKGGEIINAFLAPATCALALNIYRQWKLIKENFLALMAGTLVGSAVTISFVYFAGKLLGLENTILLSMVPKGITTPMAMAVSESIGGIPSLTVLSVIITGVTGSVLCPILVKLLPLDSPVEQGIAIGTCSHAIGTSKAIEMGELQGALSSVALTLTGIMTVILSLIFF